jgi:hypothetical protein
VGKDERVQVARCEQPCVCLARMTVGLGYSQPCLSDEFDNAQRDRRNIFPHKQAHVDGSRCARLGSAQIVSTRTCLRSVQYAENYGHSDGVYIVRAFRLLPSDDKSSPWTLLATTIIILPRSLIGCHEGEYRSRGQVSG